MLLNEKRIFVTNDEKCFGCYEMKKNVFLLINRRKYFICYQMTKMYFLCQVKNDMLTVFKWIKKNSISQNDEKKFLCYEMNKNYFLFTKLRIMISFLSNNDFILSSLLNQSLFDAKCTKIFTLLSNEEHIFQVAKRRGMISLSL